MPVEIKNQSTVPATMPYPLRGMLKAGQAVTLNRSPNDLADAIPNLGSTFTLRELPNYNGPFNTEYDLQEALSSAFVVYVDGLLGSDENNGRDVQHPVASAARAAALSPTFSDSDVVWCFLTQGNYAYAECQTRFGRTGAWSVCAAASTRATVRTGVADSGTNENAIAASGLTTNQDQHFTIEMTSGAASGYRRTVQQNTATSIVPVRRFESQDSSTAVVPAQGDTYSIYRPGVVLTGFTGMRNKRVFLWDVAFAAVTEQPIIERCEIFGAGVEFRGTVFPHFLSCTGSFGQWDQIDAINTSLFASLGGRWGLPYSPVRSAELAAWFPNVGLANSLVSLAKHRGCGMSCPDATFTTSMANALTATLCAMSLHGTFGANSWDMSEIGFGGYFYGILRANGQTFAVGTGRTGQGTVGGSVAESVYLRPGVRAYGNSQVHFLCPATVIMSGGAAWNLEEMSSIVFHASGNVLGDATASDAGGSIRRGSQVRIRGTTTLNANIGSSTSFGTISAFDGSRLMLEGGTITFNNANNRALILTRGRSEVQLSTTTTLSGVGGLQVDDGALVRIAGAVTLSGGPLVVGAGADCMLNANLTISGQAGDGIQVKEGGSLTQISGILSSVATAGDGLRADSGARVRLRSGTNTVLTGAGSGKAGCRAKGGASVWFDGAPSSVTGPSDLAVPGTNSANTVLNADDTLITGGGATIGRAA